MFCFWKKQPTPEPRPPYRVEANPDGGFCLMTNPDPKLRHRGIFKRPITDKVFSSPDEAQQYFEDYRRRNAEAERFNAAPAPSVEPQS